MHVGRKKFSSFFDEIRYKTLMPPWRHQEKNENGKERIFGVDRLFRYSRSKIFNFPTGGLTGGINPCDALKVGGQEIFSERAVILRCEVHKSTIFSNTCPKELKYGKILIRADLQLGNYLLRPAPKALSLNFELHFEAARLLLQPLSYF
ncbi:MAG: hypothetical protein ACPL5F_11745 [Moorellaceae bacterium]